MVKFHKSRVGLRFVSFLIDLLIIIVVIKIYDSIFALDLISIKTYKENYIILFFSMILFPCSLIFCYFFISENIFHKTLGKYFAKLKVISINGSNPTSYQILVRTLFRFIPIDPYSIIFDENKERFWHDLFSKTKVVYDNDDDNNSDEKVSS